MQGHDLDVYPFLSSLICRQYGQWSDTRPPHQPLDRSRSTVLPDRLGCRHCIVGTREETQSQRSAQSHRQTSSITTNRSSSFPLALNAPSPISPRPPAFPPGPQRPPKSPTDNHGQKHPPPIPPGPLPTSRADPIDQVPAHAAGSADSARVTVLVAKPAKQRRAREASPSSRSIAELAKHRRAPREALSRPKAGEKADGGAGEVVGWPRCKRRT